MQLTEVTNKAILQGLVWEKTLNQYHWVCYLTQSAFFVISIWPLSDFTRIIKLNTATVKGAVWDIQMCYENQRLNFLLLNLLLITKLQLDFVSTV